jgi:DNA-formamidopyrimidine glycosylase
MELPITQRVLEAPFVAFAAPLAPLPVRSDDYPASFARKRGGAGGAASERKRTQNEMPELPEVETTVRGLARFLNGERITRVVLNRPNLRRPFPPELVQVMTGARVTGLSRRAKYGLIHLDRDATMIFHLGMSGRWRIDPEQPEPHDHLLMETADHRFALCDPRRFGWVDLVDTAALDVWPSFAAMGPEPLGPELTTAYLKGALEGRKQAIKLCLLDQRIVAGLAVNDQLLMLSGAIPAAVLAVLIESAFRMLERKRQGGGPSGF